MQEQVDELAVLEGQQKPRVLASSELHVTAAPRDGLDAPEPKPGFPLTS